MCKKHGYPTPPKGPQNLSLFPSYYFQRLATKDNCTTCRGRVCPEEVKTALGVCTVFLLTKTVEWLTPTPKRN